MIVALRGGFDYRTQTTGGEMDWMNWSLSYWANGTSMPPIVTGQETRSIGLPAVAAAIRLVSETIGSFVMRVYEGDASQRQPRLDAPEAGLLQDGAAGMFTSMDLWSDVQTSIEMFGNAFIWKERVRGGQVAELFPFPAEACRVFADERTGRKQIEANIGGETVNVTRDVIHVRGWSPVVALTGQSTRERHKDALKTVTALESYRGRYFDNDASPNLVLIHPGNLAQQQRDELRASWKARHSGPTGEKTGILWGGMSVEQLSSTLEDAQLAELEKADVLTVTRMFRIFPPALIAATADTPLPSAETMSDHFLRFTLLPRLRRIERAVSADRDIFPDPRGPYARFDVSELLRGDIATTASKIHQLKQVGMMTANEGRAELGLPPIEGGDELQQTPVGGAPNTNGNRAPLPLMNGGGPDE